jgi:hypothetical protein
MKQRIIFTVIFFITNLFATLALIAIFSNIIYFERNISFFAFLQLFFLVICMSFKKGTDIFLDSKDNYKLDYHNTLLIWSLQAVGNSIFCVLKV